MDVHNNFTIWLIHRKPWSTFHTRSYWGGQEDCGWGLQVFTWRVSIEFCCTLHSLNNLADFPFLGVIQLDTLTNAWHKWLWLCLVRFCRSLRRVRREDIRPSDILRLMKQPARDTRNAVRAADTMDIALGLIHEKAHHIHKRSINATGQTWAKHYLYSLTLIHILTSFQVWWPQDSLYLPLSDLITEDELQLIVRLTGCAGRVQSPSCRTTPLINKYRTATSLCNNKWVLQINTTLLYLPKTKNILIV